MNDGVSSDGLFIMKDSAYVSADNDIYLDNGDITKITVTGALTPPEGSNGISATITPYSYTSNKPVLAVSGVQLSEVCGKIAVTANNEKNYIVNSSGKIEESTSVPVDNVIGLQSAITSGSSSITVTSGLSLSADVPLSPSQSVVIDGGTDKATIDGNEEYRISVTATNGDITFTNIDFSRGKIEERDLEDPVDDENPHGGMLKLVGNGQNSLTIRNCTFTNCSCLGTEWNEGYGGCLYIRGFKTVTIEDTTFYANDGDGQSGAQHRAESGGFIYIDVKSVSDSTINITGCSFTGGLASHGGALALILNDSPDHSTEMTIDNCTFTNNYGCYNGGAIDFSSGVSITVKNSAFTGNHAGGEWTSGNVFLENGRTVILENTTFDNVSGDEGEMIVTETPVTKDEWF